MNRLPDWPGRLIACVEAAREKPFAWGRHDCCTFAADCIEAMTGVDLAEGFRGTYGSARAGLERLERMGGLEGLADRFLPRLERLWCSRGDVVLVPHGLRAFLAVVIDHRAAAPGPRGLVFVPACRFSLAWEV